MSFRAPISTFVSAKVAKPRLLSPTFQRRSLFLRKVVTFLTAVLKHFLWPYISSDCVTGDILFGRLVHFPIV